MANSAAPPRRVTPKWLSMPPPGRQHGGCWRSRTNSAPDAKPRAAMTFSLLSSHLVRCWRRSTRSGVRSLRHAKHCALSSYHCRRTLRCASRSYHYRRSSRCATRSYHWVCLLAAYHSRVPAHACECSHLSTTAAAIPADQLLVISRARASRRQPRSVTLRTILHGEPDGLRTNPALARM